MLQCTHDMGRSSKQAAVFVYQFGRVYPGIIEDGNRILAHVPIFQVQMQESVTKKKKSKAVGNNLYRAETRGCLLAMRLCHIFRFLPTSPECIRLRSLSVPRC